MEGKCYDCDQLVPKIHRHHMDKNHANNTPENIMRLCPKCHKRRHSGWMIPVWDLLETGIQADFMHQLDELQARRDLQVDALNLEYRRKLAVVKAEYMSQLSEVKSTFGLPEYDDIPLHQYQRPIWTLDFFSYLKPKNEMEAVTKVE